MNKKFVRLQQLLDILHKTSKEYVSTKALSEYLKVSQKSIQRDINELRESYGIVIHQKKDEGIAISPSSPTKLPMAGEKIELSDREQITLAIAQNYYQSNAPQVFKDEALSTFHKIVSSFSLDQQKSYKDYLAMVSFEFTEKMQVTESANNILEKLVSAIKNKTRIVFVYQSLYLLQEREQASTPTRRTADPLHLRYAFGVWYLIAYCHLRKEQRTFSLSRITELEILSENYDSPAFKYKHYFAKNTRIGSESINEIQVFCRFSPEISPWVRERQWFPQQRFITRRREGQQLSTTMVFSSPSMNEILLFVSRFGANVTVLRPDYVVEEILKQSKLLITRYEKTLQAIERDSNYFEELKSHASPNNYLYELFLPRIIHFMKRLAFADTEGVSSDFYLFISEVDPLKKYDPRRNCRFLTYLCDQFYYYLLSRK